MQTPRFWQTVDRLGTFGSSLFQWRMELGEHCAKVLSCLRKLPGLATDIPDPDDPRLRLSLHPTDDDEIYTAESDDLPAHRKPIDVPVSELVRLVPDIEKLSDGLADVLGFTPRENCHGHCANIWQVGIMQPRLRETTPIYLYVPTGGFSDFDLFRTGLQTLPSGVLYLPTNRLFIPEVENVAQARGVVLESIRDRLAQSSADATSTISAIASVSRRSPKPKAGDPDPILAVQRGWKWERLSIRLNLRGHLTASYGDDRGHYEFAVSEGIDEQAKYPPQFIILYRMCAQGWWKNPPTHERHYQSTQREFSRLRKLLKTLIAIDGSPFRKLNGLWEPKFKFVPDPDLAKVLEQLVDEKPTDRVNTPRRRRVVIDDSDDAESE